MTLRRKVVALAITGLAFVAGIAPATAATAAESTARTAAVRPMVSGAYWFAVNSYFSYTTWGLTSCTLIGVAEEKKHSADVGGFNCLHDFTVASGDFYQLWIYGDGTAAYNYYYGIW